MSMSRSFRSMGGIDMACYRKAKDDIWEALQNAQENGEFEENGSLYERSADDVANDLMTYSNLGEIYTENVIIKHVKSWLADRDNLGE